MSVEVSDVGSVVRPQIWCLPFAYDSGRLCFVFALLSVLQCLPCLLPDIVILFHELTHCNPEALWVFDVVTALCNLAEHHYMSRSKLTGLQMWRSGVENGLLMLAGAVHG